MQINIGDLLECVTVTELMLHDMTSSAVISHVGDQLLVIGINGGGDLPSFASGKYDYDESTDNWLRVIVNGQSAMLDWRYMVPYEVIDERPPDHDGEDDDDDEVGVIDDPNFKLIQRGSDN